MLKTAQNYESELNAKFWDTAYDPHFMFFHSTYNRNYSAESSNFNGHDFASISPNGELLGRISYDIDQRSQTCYNMGIINFTDSLVFARDVFRAIDDIFVKYRYRKLRFTAYVGSPSEQIYNRLIRKYGGKVVGVYEKEDRLLDGKLYDVKLYEIFRDSYIKSKEDK